MSGLGYTLNILISPTYDVPNPIHLRKCFSDFCNFHKNCDICVSLIAFCNRNIEHVLENFRLQCNVWYAIFRGVSHFESGRRSMDGITWHRRTATSVICGHREKLISLCMQIVLRRSMVLLMSLILYMSPCRQS